MKGIIYSAIARRKMTAFIVLICMIFGVYNYIMIPKQESPDFKAPYAKLMTIYPGASPEEVEKQVTMKIEDMVVEVPGYKSVQSITKNSVSIVILELDSDSDIDAAWAVLKEKAKDIQGELPEAAGEIEINTDMTETAGMIISVSGDNYTYEELTAYAEDIKKELSKIDGVARFDLDGDQDKYIRVRIDMDKLNRISLSLEDVTKILAAQNYLLPLGSLDDGEAVINVTPTGAYGAIDDIRDLIINVSGESGAVMRLRDVATIETTYKDSNYKIKQNGSPAVLLTGFFQEDKNIVLIGDEVAAKIEEMAAALPDDVLFDQVLYQPTSVEKSVNDFIMNLVEALILIIVIVFIGMGFRNAIITSLSIPLSIAISFSVMALLNIEIHQISIAALIIALGMLVDNSVVVNDAIQVRIDQGEDKLAACVHGVKEVNIPILSSTLTTVGAFIPLLLLGGTAGDYIEGIPQVVMISLMASYAVAILAIPMFGFVFLKKTEIKIKNNLFKKFFVNLLRSAMKHKAATLLFTLVIFLGSMALASTLGLKFFPMADTDMVYANITVHSATEVGETEAVAKQIEAIIAAQPEVVGYTTAIGDGLPKFYMTLPLANQSADYAQIMMKLDLSKSGRFESNTYFVAHLQSELDRAIAEASIVVKELEQGDPTGAPVTVRVSGEDTQELAEATVAIEDTLSKIPGTVNVDNNLGSRVYEFNLNVDTRKATVRGLSLYEIEKEVGIALRGVQASIYKEAGNEYPIMVESDYATKEELMNMGIESSVTGKKIVLKDVADIELADTLPSIKRDDRELSVTITSDVMPGYSAVEIQNTLTDQLDGLDLGDVQLSYKGEKDKIIEYFGNMGILSIFALLIIYAILLVQFNSFRQPFVIFMTIPLSMIGSIIGLYLFRQPLSFTALLGIVSLLGMVVNNAIVLLDYINWEIGQGIELQEACIVSVEKRFRPIMLTTITTVIGLIPLVVSGGELFRPLAISLMFGLLISMFLTLVIIPVLFSIVEKRRVNKQRYPTS